MEFTTCYCPHSQYTHDGQRGFAAHLIRCGADRGMPLLLCTMCKSTFAVRQGTAYCIVCAEEPHYKSAMRALAEGNALRGTVGSSMWIRIPAVLGRTEPDDIVGL